MKTNKILAIIKNQFNDFKAKGRTGLTFMVNKLSPCLDSFKNVVNNYKRNLSQDSDEHMVKTRAGFGVVKAKCIECFNNLASSASEGTRVISSCVEKKIGKIHFNLSHLVLTSGVAVLVFALTLVATGFNKSEVKAESVEVPEVETYNETALSVNYGDTQKIANVAKEILKDEISSVQTPQKTTLSDGKEGYVLGDYIINVDTKYEENRATLSIQTKDTYNKKSEEKIIVNDENDKSAIKEGTVHQYSIKINAIDTIAPVIKLTTNSVDVVETNTTFNAREYVESVTDNKDSNLSFESEGSIESKDGEYVRGTYTITYKAKDAAGNVGTANLTVKVVEDEARAAKEAEKEKQEAEEAAASNAATSSASYANTTTTSSPSVAPSSSKGGAIAAAALSQVGVNQDCTMLVTNSLRAVGISFHGWPTDYMSLGRVVSNPEPGDIIVYSGHVAIYIGNGQAVHGGFYGYTTKVWSVQCTNPFIAYIRVS